METMKRPLLIPACLALAVACSPTLDSAPAQPAEQVERLGRGEAIAETLCATCHAVGQNGDSPHADAIPLRRLSWSYPVRSLEEPLTEGIMVGHPDMPEWQFEAEDVDALLAYLESIQEPRPI